MLKNSSPFSRTNLLNVGCAAEATPVRRLPMTALLATLVDTDVYSSIVGYACIRAKAVLFVLDTAVVLAVCWWRYVVLKVVCVNARSCSWGHIMASLLIVRRPIITARCCRLCQIDHLRWDAASALIFGALILLLLLRRGHVAKRMTGLDSFFTSIPNDGESLCQLRQINREVKSKILVVRSNTNSLGPSLFTPRPRRGTRATVPKNLTLAGLLCGTMGDLPPKHNMPHVLVNPSNHIVLKRRRFQVMQVPFVIALGPLQNLLPRHCELCTACDADAVEFIPDLSSIGGFLHGRTSLGHPGKDSHRIFA
ncbi:hypothetical protein KC361_g79 [Hortaea werneckii]|nr:hypothetical protein KC361_g79 [Hortaea werneckii]